MTTITITRDKGFADKLRKYKVLVDDEVIGTVENGGVFSHSVADGEHTIQIKIDWCKTEKLKFSANGVEKRFQVQSNLRGWKVILSLAYLFMPYKWLLLKQV